jgi:hypothetical protein
LFFEGLWEEYRMLVDRLLWGIFVFEKEEIT